MIDCPACAFRFNPSAKKPRSTPEHRHYFAMIGAAFANWPDRDVYQFQPIDPEALRLFLQMRAGWVDTVQAADGSVYMLPRSTQYEKMTQRRFHELHHRVSRIIGDIIGVPGDELLEKQSEVA